MWLASVLRFLGILSSSGSTTSSTVVSPEESGSRQTPKELPMSLSEKGLNWLKYVERLALMPYDDQTGKQISSWVKGATIGYGHLISQNEWVKYRNGITDVEAEALLRKDLERFVNAVRSIPRKLAQHEFDACVILA